MGARGRPRKFQPGYDFRSSETLRAQQDHASGDSAGQPCARGNRCEERDWQGQPRLGPRAFCETDSRYIKWDIRDLPLRYAELRGLLAAAGQAGERVSGSREPPIPLAVDVEAFMAEIVYVACAWETVVREKAHLSAYPPGRRRPAVRLADACRTLVIQFEVLLNLPSQPMLRQITMRRVTEIITDDTEGDRIDPARIVWDPSGQPWETRMIDGVGAALEFLALTGRARGMLGVSRQRRRITEVPCDECQGKTLVQAEARDGGWEPSVRCTACPNAYTGARYELLMGRVYQAQLEALEDSSGVSQAGS